jgi:hypothetical protein
VARLPPKSTATASTVVSPSGNTLPDAGVTVTGTGPSFSSMALTANGTAAPDGPVASTVMSSDTSISGGVSSRSRMKRSADAV